MDQPEVVSALFVLGWIELIKRVGGFMVIAGVAIEVGGDWLSGPYHKIVDDARELEIAQLTNDAARLTSENFALQKVVAQRHVGAMSLLIESPKSMDNFEGMERFAGTQVFIQPSDDTEAKSLAAEILLALTLRKWKASQVDDKQSGMLPGLISEGVSITYPIGRPKAAVPAQALVDTLTKSGLGVGDNSVSLFTTVQGVKFPLFDPQTEWVYVMVGSRPISLTVQWLAAKRAAAVGTQAK
jgi:hypothetical protein